MIKQVMLAYVLEKHPDAIPCGGETLADSFEWSETLHEWFLWYSFPLEDFELTTDVLTETRYREELRKKIKRAYVKTPSLKEMEHTLKDTTIVSY